LNEPDKYTMKRSKSQITLLLLSLNVLSSVITAIPVTYSIDKGNKECLYDTLERDEYVTVSVLIDGGLSLTGEVVIEGPIAPKTDSTGAGLKHAIEVAEKRKHQPYPFTQKYEVDYEHFGEHDLLDDYYDDDDDDDIDDDDDDDFIDDDVAFQDYYYDDEDDDDDDDEFEIDDDMNEEEIADMRRMKAERDATPTEIKQAEKAKKRIEQSQITKAAHDKRKEQKRQRDAKKLEKEAKLSRKKVNQRHRISEESEKAQSETEPVQKTFKVKADGWYRTCVHASSNSIDAEFEMRKSSEVGSPHHETGHLQSYEKHNMRHQEKKMFHRNLKESEGVADDEDFEKTHDGLHKLYRLINEIGEKQVNERHRLNIHASVNDHSHSRMVLRSLFETIFYVAVSGLQVYTIRKWFSGAPMLGR